MGILDFREICSPNPHHSSVKDAVLGSSNLPDDFELFCQEFFTQVKRFRIFRSVSNGPDLGIDLGVEETTIDGPIRWLVSCKHYAHSNQYIPEKVELNIVEKVSSWGCDGFIPFYTKVPSTGLSQVILGAEKFIKVERYYKERIEHELLSNSLGTAIAARYFPVSMTNHYQNIIKPLTQYSLEDIKIENNIASLGGLSVGLPGDIENSTRHLERLVKNANIMAGFEQHKSYFKKTLKDAISQYPEMFILKDGYDDCSYSYVPSWDIFHLVELAQEHGLSKAYFISSVWSFWDYREANDNFADFMIVWSSNDFRSQEDFDIYKKTNSYKECHSSYLQLGLLTPGLLGLKLQDNERDIVARLFAYANAIPTR